MSNNCNWPSLLADKIHHLLKLFSIPFCRRFNQSISLNNTQVISFCIFLTQLYLGIK